MRSPLVILCDLSFAIVEAGEIEVSNREVCERNALEILPSVPSCFRRILGMEIYKLVEAVDSY